MSNVHDRYYRIINTEVRKLIDGIIVIQQKEINLMKKLLNEKIIK